MIRQMLFCCIQRLITWVAVPRHKSEIDPSLVRATATDVVPDHLMDTT